MFPALDVHFPATHDPNLLELLFARLDDFQPTAIQEGAGCAAVAWPTPAEPRCDEPRRSARRRALRVFFSTSSARNAALDALVCAFANRGVSGHPLDVDDEDWAARSQAELRAVEVGRIVIAPPWDVPKAAGDLITIVVEPSMAFGTGHHASTRLCLNALQSLDHHGRRLLDIGTGSGVLAIAAVLLGAEHVTAIDVDSQALQSARENAARNAAASGISFQQADFRDARLNPADVVLANLTGAILGKTFDRLVELAAPAGCLILSGFTQEEIVARPDGPLATSSRVQVVDQLDEDGWRCFILRRR